MEDQWRISEYDGQWKRLFQTLATNLRNNLGDVAVRIDHIGSTSIEGMAAKPIIDVQISVTDLDNELLYRDPIEGIGFRCRSDNPGKTKRYFREVPGGRRTHIHVRQAGSIAEQMNLLFRDYLRNHPVDCLRYAEEKHRLMKQYKQERSKYVERKGPIVWEIMQRAHIWSMEMGWKPNKSDM